MNDSLSLKHLCSQLYNLQGLAVYKEKVPFVLCGNLATLRISYSKAGKYDNDIFITQLKLGQPRWHHAFMHSAQKHMLPNCAEPDLAAGNGRKSRQSSFQLCWYVYSLFTHTHQHWVKDRLLFVVSDEARTELWIGEDLQNILRPKGHFLTVMLTLHP